MGIKNNIKRYITKSIIRLRPLPEHKPSGKPINLQDGKTVLFFSFTTDDEHNAIRSFAKNMEQNHSISKVVAYSCEINADIPNEDVSIFYIGQNDFNLFGKINKRLKHWFLKNDFDLLLSFAYESELFCDIIISNINSGFKAGYFDQRNVNLFDLTINHKQEDYNEQFEHFNHYINKLNISI